MVTQKQLTHPAIVGLIGGELLGEPLLEAVALAGGIAAAGMPPEQDQVPHIRLLRREARIIE